MLRDSIMYVAWCLQFILLYLGVLKITISLQILYLGVLKITINLLINDASKSFFKSKAFS